MAARLLLGAGLYLPTEALSRLERFLRGIMALRVKRAGEPFINFFMPERMKVTLEGAGLHSVEDLGVEELNARYFSGRTDGLSIKGRSLYVASALV